MSDWSNHKQVCTTQLSPLMSRASPQCSPTINEKLCYAHQKITANLARAAMACKSTQFIAEFNESQASFMQPGGPHMIMVAPQDIHDRNSPMPDSMTITTTMRLHDFAETFSLTFNTKPLLDSYCSTDEGDIAVYLEL
jgi:hypothetical protein